MLIATLLSAPGGAETAEAVEQAQPLIDIDGTVFIQFGIFVVMGVVLWVTVFKPYFKVLQERELRIEGARKDAGTMQERAEGLLSDYDGQLRKAKQHGAAERLKLRAEGQAHEREVLAEARAIGQAGLRGAQASAKREGEAARAGLALEAQAIGRRIAGRVLGRNL